MNGISLEEYIRQINYPNIVDVDDLCWEIYCYEMRLLLINSEIFKKVKKKIIAEDKEKLRAAYRLAYSRYWGVDAV